MDTFLILLLLGGIIQCTSFYSYKGQHRKNLRDFLDDFELPQGNFVTPSTDGNNAVLIRQADEKDQEKMEIGWSDDNCMSGSKFQPQPARPKNVNIANGKYVFDKILTSDFNYFSIKAELACSPKLEKLRDFQDIKEVLSQYSVIRFAVTGNRLVKKNGAMHTLKQSTWVINVREEYSGPEGHLIKLSLISPEKGEILVDQGFNFLEYFSDSIPTRNHDDRPSEPCISDFLRSFLSLQKPIILEGGLWGVLSLYKLTSNCRLPDDLNALGIFLKRFKCIFIDLEAINSPMKTLETVSLDLEAEQIGKAFFDSGMHLTDNLARSPFVNRFILDNNVVASLNASLGNDHQILIQNEKPLVPPPVHSMDTNRIMPMAEENTPVKNCQPEPFPGKTDYERLPDALKSVSITTQEPKPQSYASILKNGNYSTVSLQKPPANHRQQQGHTIGDVYNASSKLRQVQVSKKRNTIVPPTNFPLGDRSQRPWNNKKQ